MRRRSLFMIILLAGGALRGDFNPGGVTLDLSHAQLQGEKCTVKNLIPSIEGGLDAKNDGLGWKSGFNFQGVSDERRKTLKRQYAPYFKASVSNGRIVIENLPQISAARDPSGEPTVTNAVYRRLILPDGGRLVLKFSAQGIMSPGPGLNRGRYAVSLLDTKSGKRIGKDISNYITVGISPQLQQVAFDAPPGGCLVQVAFFVYGLGRLQIDELSLCKALGSQQIAVHLHPYAHAGNVFHAPSHRPALLYFMQNNAEGLKLSHPELRLGLPDGVNVIGATANYDSPHQDGNEWVIPLDRARIVASDYWAGPVVIRADLPAGTGPERVTYYIRNNGSDGTRKSFDLVIDPAPRATRRPRKFLSGFHSTSLHRFTDVPMGELVSFYRECGFNLVNGSYEVKGKYGMIDLYRQAGFMTVWWPTRPGPNDGYDMGAADKPEAVRYLLADGKFLSAHRNGWMICPEEAASGGEHYRRSVASPLQGILKKRGYDLLSSNWEPQDGFRGCFCNRCREAFIRDSGLPADEVRAAWPGQVIDKWRDRWLAFRAHQHGRLLANVENDVGAAGTGAHFAPAVCIDTLCEPTWNLFAQYGSPDFIDKLKWIVAWGPYLYYDMRLPYFPETGIHLKSFFAASQVRQFIADRIQDPRRRPKIISEPQHLQCFYWITVPEAPAFECIGYFLNGWEANMAYLFPMGADCRTFQAMADANSAIAECEDIVFGGTRLPPPRLQPVSPLPKSAFHGFESHRYPGMGKAELIQAVAWKNGEKTLLAVGNFWQDAECFFRLVFPGLPSDEVYTLRQAVSGETFAPTGDELANGVLLHVGAFRWNLYTLTAGRPQDKYYTEKDLLALMKTRSPRIAELARNAEKMRLNLQREDTMPDYSNIASVQNDGITLTPVENGRLTIGTPRFTATLDLARGAAIVSWIVDGQEFAAAPVAYDGFLGKNACVITSPYGMVCAKGIPGGLEITASRQLSKSDSVTHRQLIITKRMAFMADRIIIDSCILNPTGESKSFQFRFHSMPAFKERMLDGRILPRTFATLNTAPGKMCWHAGGATIEAIVPEARLDHIMHWDGSTCRTPTFEPVFRETALTAGTHEHFNLEYRIR